MTENQLKYLAYEESVRHNTATEEIGRTDASTRRMSAEEAQRANLAQEKEIHRSNVKREAETERSNRAREVETERSNIVKETETNRANMVDEAHDSQRLEEEARANRARETETERNNRAIEAIKSAEASTKAADVASKAHARNAKSIAGILDAFIPG